MGHDDLDPQCACAMANGALSCVYEDIISQQLACFQMYNAECDDVHDSYHEVEIMLTESQRTELSLTQGDLTQFISSQLCQQDDYCMIPAGGINVGEIGEDGTVVIWLNITSAMEESEWGLRESIEDALRLGEIQASIAEAQEQQATESTSSSAASTSEAGSGMMMFAAAGAVVIIIIIVVMKRGSNKSGAASRKADRTVVAFENPMYADGNAGGGGGYDQGGGGEGLYDEPAFNAGNEAKQNPMYESTEDLAEGPADGDDGGYLDVAPDDDE